MGSCRLIPTGRTRGARREYRCAREDCGQTVFDDSPPETIRLPCRSAETAERPPAPARRWLPLPGDVLAWAIKRIAGEEFRPDCRCRERMRIMNCNGWRWSWRNRRTIYGWLAEEAARRKISVEAATFWGLVRTARREARRRASR